MKIYYIILVMLLFSFSCNKYHYSQVIRYATSNDKQVVRKNCSTCHAPVGKLESIVGQNEMLPKFGYKGLEKYLQNNFKHKTDCQVVEHCPIKLTNKEIASILIFLKEYR